MNRDTPHSPFTPLVTENNITKVQTRLIAEALYSPASARSAAMHLLGFSKDWQWESEFNKLERMFQGTVEQKAAVGTIMTWIKGGM